MATRIKPHYAWIVLAVTFLTLLASAGVRAVPGVLIIPLEQEFHWTRATISFAISVNLLLYGLMGPFAGALMQSFGVRRTTMTAMAMLAVGVALATKITAAWQLILLWGVVVGLATGMVAIVLGATVVNRWFVERRGLALGILTASTATGQLVFLPMIEHHGWRWAIWIVAGASAVMIPLVGFFMRDRPADVGAIAFGATANDVVAPLKTNPAAAAIAALGDGVRSRDFWLLFATFFICGASTNGLVATHLIPAAHDHGIPEVRAAGLLALMGVFDLVGTTGSGWLTDRWDSRALLAWYYSLRGLSLIFLPFALAGGNMSLLVFAVWYGLDWIATVPPTVKLATDAFGKERAPIMFGWIAAGHQLGAAITAFSAGWIRTTLGDYQFAFWISGGLCVIAALLSLAVGRRSSLLTPTLPPTAFET
ncbi:MAG TPA: MFS transporter [Gemmatimonadaceae bacterium]|jgi:MFS family permease